MQKYYSEIQDRKENEDAKNWQVKLAESTIEDVQAFQERALPWYEW